MKRIITIFFLILLYSCNVDVPKYEYVGSTKYEITHNGHLRYARQSYYAISIRHEDGMVVFDDIRYGYMALGGTISVMEKERHWAVKYDIRNMPKWRLINKPDSVYYKLENVISTQEIEEAY